MLLLTHQIKFLCVGTQLALYFHIAENVNCGNVGNKQSSEMVAAVSLLYNFRFCHLLWIKFQSIPTYWIISELKTIWKYSQFIFDLKCFSPLLGSIHFIFGWIHDITWMLANDFYWNLFTNFFLILHSSCGWNHTVRFHDN